MAKPRTDTIRIVLNPSHMRERNTLLDLAKGLRLKVEAMSDDGTTFYVEGFEFPLRAFLQALAGDDGLARSMGRFNEACDAYRAKLAKEEADRRDRRRQRIGRLLAPLRALGRAIA